MAEFVRIRNPPKVHLWLSFVCLSPSTAITMYYYLNSCFANPSHSLTSGLVQHFDHVFFISLMWLYNELSFTLLIILLVFYKSTDRLRCSLHSQPWLTSFRFCQFIPILKLNIKFCKSIRALLSGDKIVFLRALRARSEVLTMFRGRLKNKASFSTICRRHSSRLPRVSTPQSSGPVGSWPGPRFNQAVITRRASSLASLSPISIRSHQAQNYNGAWFDKLCAIFCLSSNFGGHLKDSSDEGGGCRPANEGSFRRTAIDCTKPREV